MNNHELWVKIIDKRAYIKMINIRTLKRICGLTGVHLYHERSNTLPSGYYISTKQLDKFIKVMNDSSINVNFIGKEKHNV